MRTYRLQYDFRTKDLNFIGLKEREGADLVSKGWRWVTDKQNKSFKGFFFLWADCFTKAEFIQNWVKNDGHFEVIHTTGKVETLTGAEINSLCDSICGSV
jgi:hypothetical protein